MASNINTTSIPYYKGSVNSKSKQIGKKRMKLIF